jgi:hypothetical protein
MGPKKAQWEQVACDTGFKKRISEESTRLAEHSFQFEIQWLNALEFKAVIVSLSENSVGNWSILVLREI